MGDGGMTKLYLIRHAEAEGNLYRIAHGHCNGLITNYRGYQQIDALRERFRDVDIDAVYSSDLYRTQITARAIWLPKALPLHLEPAFREICMGEWEDHTWHELNVRYPEEMYNFNRRADLWRVPGAETAQQVVDRFIPALERVARRHEGGAVAVFSHGMALRTVLVIFRSQPLLIVLNALPVGFLLLTFAFLFKNIFYGAALVNFFVCALSLFNRVKIEVRDEPVFPRDFALVREVGSAMQTYDIRYPVTAIALVALTTALLAALGVFVTSRPVSFAVLKAKVKKDAAAVLPGRCWPERIIGAVLSFGVLTALIFTVYASNDLYNSFRVSNAYYVPSVFNELGFPYCFCHQFTTYPVDRPEGFSKSEAAGWETGEQTGLGQDVSIIMVMNEAFSDITDQPMFDWTEETDPLPNLHALQNDPHAVSGHIVVPGFAGGTANTEFDVLTGMQTNALSATTTSAMRVVNRNLDH